MLRMIVQFRVIACLATALVCSAIMRSQAESKPLIKVPYVAGTYSTIYCPARDVFPGPDTLELKAGYGYEEWVPNDHTFIKDLDGRWNLFGITHPLTSTKSVHEGEFQSSHALAPIGLLKDVIGECVWKDLPKVLRAPDRPGETPGFYAPYVIRRGSLFYMFYAPDPIRWATSPDLKVWTPRGVLFSNEPSTRDPSVILWRGVYYMVYCTEDNVALRTSKDLRQWSSPRIILQMPDGISPESPSIVRKDGTFYLFLCVWNGVWDEETVDGAYQHRTYVYQSDNIMRFDSEKKTAVLDSHAPEVFQGEDGQWYISSVEWPHRGVSIAMLNWK